MVYDYNIIEFEKYCPTCKFKAIPDTSTPCDECMHEAARPNTFKPLNYIRNTANGGSSMHHCHANKHVLDKITDRGDGSKFLADDGTYKLAPNIKVKVNNETTYILTITTSEGTFDTPNLRGNGSYVPSTDPTVFWNTSDDPAAIPTPDDGNLYIFYGGKEPDMFIEESTGNLIFNDDDNFDISIDEFGHLILEDHSGETNYINTAEDGTILDPTPDDGNLYIYYEGAEPDMEIQRSTGNLIINYEGEEPKMEINDGHLIVEE